MSIFRSRFSYRKPNPRKIDKGVLGSISAYEQWRRDMYEVETTHVGYSRAFRAPLNKVLCIDKTGYEKPRLRSSQLDSSANEETGALVFDARQLFLQRQSAVEAEKVEAVTQTPQVIEHVVVQANPREAETGPTAS